MKKFWVLNIIMLFTTSAILADCYSDKQTWPEGCDDSDLFRQDKRVIFTNLEFLYWTANSGNLEYAFEQQNTSTLASGKYLFSSYDWDPSFRVQVGYFNAPKTYQVIGQYTWVKINGKRSTNVHDGKFLCATVDQSPLNLDEFINASSTIKVFHQLGDFLASRVWYPNLHCRLRLFGGLTGGILEQKWNINYTDINQNIENVYSKWKFTGVGLRIGVDLDWFWSHHFYITGRVSSAPFVGKYDNLSKITVTGSDPTKLYDGKPCEYNQYRASFNIQAYFGPSYQRAFDALRFEIFAGYELNAWFNVQEKILNSLSSNNEVIPVIGSSLFLLHGLTTRLTLDF